MLSVSVWRETKRLYSRAFFTSVVSRDWVGTQSAATGILKGSMYCSRARWLVYSGSVTNAWNQCRVEGGWGGRLQLGPPMQKMSTFMEVWRSADKHVHQITHAFLRWNRHGLCYRKSSTLSETGSFASLPRVKCCLFTSVFIQMKQLITCSLVSFRGAHWRILWTLDRLSVSLCFSSSCFAKLTSCCV